MNPATSTIHVEIDRELDGRFIAEVVSIPGALAYGDTLQEAIDGAVAIAKESGQ